MFNGAWEKFRNPWVVTGAVLALVVVIGLGLFAAQVVGYVRHIRKGEPNPFEKAKMEATVVQLLSQPPLSGTDRARIEQGKNPTLGNPEAEIRIVEFLDYECPFCRKSAPELRAFMSRHAEDVFLVVRDFPIESAHANALNASLAARCIFIQGVPNMYWAYHDLLFKNQERLGAEHVRGYAASVGADLAAFDACVASRKSETEIRASYADGVAVGVRGTPTFFVNGIRIPGAIDAATLELILEKLKQAAL